MLLQAFTHLINKDSKEQLLHLVQITNSLFSFGMPSALCKLINKANFKEDIIQEEKFLDFKIV